eukprot:5041958-Amphidinium_carterae.1
MRTGMRDRRQLWARRLCRDAQEKEAFGLMAMFRTWKHEVQRRRLQLVQPLLRRLQVAQQAVELAACWSCWRNAVHHGWQSRLLRHNRLARLDACSVLVKKLTQEFSFSLLRDCIVCWSAQSVPPPTLCEVRVPPAANSDRDLLQRRSKALETLSASVLAQQLQLCKLGAFASWRVGVKLQGEEIVAPPIVELRSNFATSKCLAGLIAASLEVAVAGAFACWRVACRLRVSEDAVARRSTEAEY